MSGFFEAAGLTKPVQQQQPAQNNQQSQQQPGGNQGANTPVQPPAGATQPNGNPTPNSNVNGSNQAVDPMAAYATMFTNNPDKQGEVAPSFSIDGKVLDTVTGQLDFTKNVPPDLMQKAMGGDMKSFMDIMNHVGREAYRNSLQHSSAMTDKFVGMREEFNGKRLPNLVREELTMGEITGGAGAKSPIVRQQLVEIAKKYQAANPDASPQQVAAAAKQYVADLYGALNPEASPAAQAKNAQAQEVNWDSYFDAN